MHPLNAYRTPSHLYTPVQMSAYAAAVERCRPRNHTPWLSPLGAMQPQQATPGFIHTGVLSLVHRAARCGAAVYRATAAAYFASGAMLLSYIGTSLVVATGITAGHAAFGLLFGITAHYRGWLDAALQTPLRKTCAPLAGAAQLELIDAILPRQTARATASLTGPPHRILRAHQKLAALLEKRLQAIFDLCFDDTTATGHSLMTTLIEYPKLSIREQHRVLPMITQQFAATMPHHVYQARETLQALLLTWEIVALQHGAIGNHAAAADCVAHAEHLHTRWAYLLN